jgi:hypothetical protein
MVLCGLVLVLGTANFFWGFSPFSIGAAAFIVMAASAIEDGRKFPGGDVGLFCLGAGTSLFLLFGIIKGLST